MDLKPENVLFDTASYDSAVLKIVDFSLSCFVDTPMEPGGTPGALLAAYSWFLEVLLCGKRAVSLLSCFAECILDRPMAPGGMPGGLQSLLHCLYSIVCSSAGSKTLSAHYYTTLSLPAQ